MARYTVAQYSIDTLLSWVKSGEIAIPEIQRPFVWEPVQVRDLLDSLYRGYPIGYLITWRTPKLRLKDGTLSTGKRILIDGQQRITALMTALLGREVLNKDYESVRIRIAFNPQEERFEVANPAIDKNPAWITDISQLFTSPDPSKPPLSLFQMRRNYCAKNPNVSEEAIEAALQKLRDIEHHQVGVIELADDLDIETVTEIFIRVNSKGVELSQADFAMSKIASGESYGGPLLRKAIDYFCRLARDRNFVERLEKQDKEFAQSEFWPAISWLGKVRHGLLYDPTYTDVLRVVSISEFARGKMGDLVALLSGRNFETKTYEEDIARESFEKLGRGILAFVKKTHFERFTMILQSAGFVRRDLITSRNAVNFAYVVYLRGRSTSGLSADELEKLVRRWYAMSILTGRYSGSIETIFDKDIKGIAEKGIREYVTSVITSELPETFWIEKLPTQMETTSTDSPYFIAFLAAQVFFKDKGFLSKTIEVEKLLSHISDKHHIFPRKYLQRLGLSRSQYNQIANLAITQSEINIAIGDTPPAKYFSELLDQAKGGPIRYGGITDMETLRENFKQNALPDYLLWGHVPDYETFLKDRRQLMAQRIKKWFESL
jgi:hypothetical protein